MECPRKSARIGIFGCPQPLRSLIIREASIEIILIGDSGVRLNGTEILRMEKDLDLITSTLRRVAWPIICRKTSEPARQEQMSRRITWHGTRQPLDGFDGVLDGTDVGLIEELALEANIEALPHVPKGDIENLVTGGIVNAQGGYQNDASTVLGYACVDGFEIPESLIRIESIPRAVCGASRFFPTATSSRETASASLRGNGRLRKSNATIPQR